MKQQSVMMSLCTLVSVTLVCDDCCLKQNNVSATVFNRNEPFLLSFEFLDGFFGPLTYLLSGLGQLDSQATTGRRLTNTSFASHKDPLEALLVDDILQRRLGKIGVVDVFNVAHVG